MYKQTLGLNGPEVSKIGLGAMSFAGFFGPTDTATSHRCMDAALDIGIDFIDTADLYGNGLSEEIIGTYLASNPNAFKIATKAGIRTQPTRCFDNSPAYLETALDASLSRLGVDYVDLFYIHRRDPSRPIEDVVETLKGFIDAGKIGGYGLSEVSPTTVRRAHAVHPCMAVQNEYSLWSRLPDLGVIKTCQDLGITFVPFSPLARGMLTDTVIDISAMPDDDFRKNNPRFLEPNFSDNLAQLKPFKDFAHDNGWTSSATALAWVLTRASNIIPIPATRFDYHLRDWAGATDITLTADHLRTIDTLLPVGWAYGDRYSTAQYVGPETYA